MKVKAINEDLLITAQLASFTGITMEAVKEIHVKAADLINEMALKHGFIASPPRVQVHKEPQ